MTHSSKRVHLSCHGKQGCGDETSGNVPRALSVRYSETTLKRLAGIYIIACL